MRIGWHTDWASRFPFAALGLPNNYRIPSPGIVCFGFQYDDSYLNSSGTEMKRSLAAAEALIQTAAAERRLTLSEYRSRLRHSFARAKATPHRRREAQENEDEQE